MSESFYDFGLGDAGDVAVAPQRAAAPKAGRSTSLGMKPPTGQGLEAVVEACAGLTRSLDGVLAVIVATSDGMLIHSTWNEVEGMRAAAISAAALGLGQRIASDFGQGDFQDSVVTTADRAIGIYAVGDRYVLGVVAEADKVSLGLLHLSARQTAGTLQQVLAQS
jgi:predicted regulator of Ras-like GTPase activity (Roadblock/LC7/MglB family)